MTNFKTTSLGAKRKSFSHNLSFDNNTTMDFGFLQPLLSQYLEPKSKVKLSAKQLVRLAPMPTPSFARMYVQNYAQFVKMTDVVPYYEALLSRMTYRGSSGSSFRPTSMPIISNKILCAYLFNVSSIHAYEKQADSSYIPYSGSNSVPEAELNDLLLGSSWKGPKLSLSFSTLQPTTPENADYIVHTEHFVFCIKYSLKAIHLRKQLIGLGYGLNVRDNHPVTLAPILAYYKAYFDRFGLSRDFSFLETNCFSVIKLIEDYNYNFYTAFVQNGSIYTAMRNSLWSFLNDLSNVYYTSANDILSVHRSNPNNSFADGLLPFNTYGNENFFRLSSKDDYETDKTLYPYITTADGTTPVLDNISLETLKRLSSYVAKDSAIGKRLSDWVRVHYGTEVSNSLFESTFNVASWRTNISIDDVFSTSDTADLAQPNKGEYLGSYAGKGIGFANGSFEFTASYAGYLFVLSCVVPESGIFQGNDPTLYAVDWDHIPHPEFDALGYELTPLSCFITDNGVSSSDDTTDYTDGSFGYVPRYTGFKFKKNVVNGYMYQGYFERDLQPYYNDRIITNNYLGFKGDKNKFTIHLLPHRAPTASTSWQKLCEYSFLSDFNRLFYNNSASMSNPPHDVTSIVYENLDNFIVQTVFDFRVSNWMMPLSMSYDTLTDGDNTTVDVKNN